MKQDLVFTWGEFRSIASLAEVASKDLVTPIICGINITIEDDVIVAQATDRYRVGRVTIPRDNGSELSVRGNAGDSFTLDAARMKKVAALIKPTKKTTRDFVMASYEYDQEDYRDDTTGYIRNVRLNIISATLSTTIESTNYVTSSYPPVGRLVDEAAAYNGSEDDGGIVDRITFNMNYLGSMAKIIHPGDLGKTPDKLNLWEMKTPYYGAADRRKPKPLYANYLLSGADTRYSAEFLVQPNLMLR